MDACKPQLMQSHSFSTVRPVPKGLRCLPFTSACQHGITHKANLAIGYKMPGSGAVAHRQAVGARRKFLQVATTDSIPEAAQTPAEAAAPASASDSFNWHQQWYPIIAVSNLSASKPYGFHLLGKALVAWSTGPGSWSVMEDRCPHRLAPLSEGRIEPSTGHLQCSYHGWTFDSKGRCSNIPQIGDPAAKATACGSSRSCVTAYPTKVWHGLLWVWVDSSAEGAALAEKELPSGLIPEVLNARGSSPDPDSGYLLGSWFHRDLPLGWGMLVENVQDPAHVPFTHHGVEGRREQEQGSSMALTTEVAKEGYAAQFVRSQWPERPMGITFKPPCLVRYEAGGAFIMAVYTIPTRPGWSRVIHCSMMNLKSPRMSSPVVQAVLKATSKVPFWAHIHERHSTLDGDTYFLHLVERQVLSSQTPVLQQYYMPSNTDTLVTTLRKWVAKHGGQVPGQAASAAELPAELAREAALDRYHQHTVECRDCQQALKLVNAAATAAAVAGIVSAAAAVALLIMAGPAATGVRTPALLLAAAAAAAAIRQWLGKLQAKFYYEQYDHSTK